MAKRLSHYASDDYDPKVRPVRWAIACLLFIALIGGLIWGFKVLTAGAKGAGDARIIKEDARNRIRQQEGFEKLHAAIVAADRTIDVADTAVKADPADPDAKVRATGTRTFCIGLVADYNAKARSYTAEQFRAADLPRQIGGDDSTTDCKGRAER